ncbi:MerC domain-containing protein [Saccharicrinis aurantiacus]|uniref:MerC domain-containing protein n=1 Tax=Saccharicrinis aurantiacus TaxID=1849719 RepID=UPI003CD0DF84
MINRSIKTIVSADSIGIASSTLCLIHCITTPFIFIAQACTSSCCATAPIWWKVVDFIFLAISFIAVYFSAKSSSKNWISISLYLLFGMISLLIINEHLIFFDVAIFPLYIAASLLAGLHFYNRKCSKCSNNCCSIKKQNTNYTLINKKTAS